MHPRRRRKPAFRMLFYSLVGFRSERYHLRSSRLIMMVKMMDKINPVVRGRMKVKLSFLNTISPDNRNREIPGRKVRNIPARTSTTPSTIRNLAR